MGNSCAGGPVNGPAAAAAAATTGEPALEPARAEHAPAACPAARAKAAQRGDAAAAAVGEPLYRPTMWLATARPVGKLNAFLGDTAPPRGHPALAVLAYQPDCRAFCAKGDRCRRQNDPEHACHYSHVAVSALQVAAAARTPSVLSNWPPGLGSPPAAAAELPFVQNCWALLDTGGGGAGAGAAAQSARAGAGGAGELPERTTVVVYVHGWRQGYLRCRAAAGHLESVLLGACPEPEPEHPSQPVTATMAPFAVLAFLWPSHKNKQSYRQAVQKTGRAGVLLRRLLEELTERRGCRVVLVGHSLGCRVSLEALHSPALEALSRHNSAGMGSRGRAAAEMPPSTLACTVVLLAPAVADTALKPDGEYAATGLRSGEVVALHSSRDEVLGSGGFGVGEALAGRGKIFGARSALGLVGPAGGLLGKEEGGGVVRAVDVSAEVGQHSAHAWLGSPAVAAVLEQAVLGGAAMEAAGGAVGAAMRESAGRECGSSGRARGEDGDEGSGFEESEDDEM